MTNVEQIKIESDERGYELHLIVDDDIEVSPEGRAVLNIQGVVFDLLSQVRMFVGPYVDEARAARREYDSGVADDPAQQEVLDEIVIRGHTRHLGEGQKMYVVPSPPSEEAAEAMREAADIMRKREKGE